MNGDRQPELFGPLSKSDDTGQNADCRNGDVARADAKPRWRIENRQRRVDGLPVHEWLTHPHEHDVRHLLWWIEQPHLAHLTGDLEHLEIAREAHRARRAERTLKRAPRLRRNAESESGSLGNRDRFNEFAVVQPEEEFFGSVARRLPRYHA